MVNTGLEMHAQDFMTKNANMDDEDFISGTLYESHREIDSPSNLN